MALTVFSSNRIESLQQQLSRDLAAHPPADPFRPEIVVVPTYAMGRWLNLRLAQQRGIAANIDYPPPVQWIWQLASTLLDDLPAQDPSTAEALAWHCFELLPGLLDEPGFEPLQTYLADDISGQRRWQLAQRIAHNFDRYQSYRPMMIRDWDRGQEQNWQACLWRRLIESRGLTHRVETIERLVAALDDSTRFERLQQSYRLFALSSLPPLYFEVVAQLARRVEINLYQHSPTDQYWADLEAEKRRARRRLQNPEEDALFETGNELLASWGRQGQTFQDLLLASDSLETIDVALYQAPDDSSLLGRLQDSIFRVSTGAGRIDADESVSFHVCHSPLRECQVLRDRLYAMFEQDPTLTPEDILVMIPDISTYAPYIEAVFRGESLPFNLSDTTLVDEHPQVSTFLDLLRLPQSRFALSEILTLLENDSLRRRFELEADDRDAIDRLIEQAHPRWGLDGAHKARLGLPPTAANTWRQAQDRFYAAYALATDELWQDVAPLQHCGDGEAEIIGRLWRLLDTLDHWRHRLAQPAPAAEWRQRLLRLVEDFFVETDPRESRLQSIRDAIASLPDDSREDLFPQLIADLMTSALAVSEQSGRLYAGGVTFCGMRPMRSIPFRVICLLGMNRGDFPRRDPHDDFELIAETPGPGDPGRRIEDRYLMLETLLCARDQLYVSYVGRSVKDNSPTQPSVMVRELIDFIDGIGEAGTPLSQALIHEYPLQAFSPNNFIAPSFSYSSYWCDVARDLVCASPASPSAWPEQPLLDESPPAQVELARLRQFARHPVRFFFQHRLGLFLEQADDIRDDEVFELGGLDRWRLRQQLADDSLRQRDDSLQRLLASGQIAHGPAAFAQAQDFTASHAAWLEALADYGQGEHRSVPVEIDLDEFRVSGVVAGYFPGRGLMAHHAGRVGGGVLSGIWLSHLALSAADCWQDSERGVLMTPDETRVFEPLPRSRARELLLELCRLYIEGSRLPLPVLPRCSFAWAASEDRSRAAGRAWAEWLNQFTGGGDADDPYLGLVLQNNRPPIDDLRFGELAEQLYRQALDASISE